MSQSQTASSGPVPSKGIADVAQIVVSVLAMAIFTAALALAAWFHDPSLPILLGAASSMATTAIGYWLGSSSGSKGKDAVLAGMATPAAPPATQGVQQP